MPYYFDMKQKKLHIICSSLKNKTDLITLGMYDDYIDAIKRVKKNGI